MREQKFAVNRTWCGILALVCLGSGIAVLLSDPADMLGAALLRVGLLVGAFWYALPSKDREAAWANVSPYVLVGLVVVAVFARRLLVFLPLLIVIGVVALLVRPRPKRRPTRE